METLVEVLTTPSAEVQRAVAACLPPLMPGLAKDREYLEHLIQRLLDRLFKGKTYGDRFPRPHAPGTSCFWPQVGEWQLLGIGKLAYPRDLTCCRKGAAYGIAGVVKGLGISAINGYGILGAFKNALEDKVSFQCIHEASGSVCRTCYERFKKTSCMVLDWQDDVTKREGALLAIEGLCTTLGRYAP